VRIENKQRKIKVTIDTDQSNFRTLNNKDEPILRIVKINHGNSINENHSMKTTQSVDQIIYFLKQCADAIKIQTNNPTVLKGAEIFSQRIQSPTEKQFNPHLLPVIAQIEHLSSTPFTFNFQQIATEMVWRPSPRTDEKGEQMALGIFNEVLDLGDIVVGLLVVDKHQSYPLHQHRPQELYLVLSGTGDWRYGGSEEFNTLVPGDVIHNHPNDLHGVNALDEPILALYVLWK
jgi:quercetin dioxygenase-like cupin family protein